MAGEEIWQDTRTVEQIVDGMSLFDDDLMSMVFDGNIEATELQDSYMVFITRTDIFKHGIPIYTINCHFEETNELFDDGSHIVYVNGNYKGDDTIGRLMHDFGCKEAKDMYYPELAKGVKHFKEEGGRERMCEAVEKYAKDYAEEYADRKMLDKQKEMIKNLMESMKWSAEQAMNVLGVNEHDREILLKKL